jgi:hypothetical protein
MVEWWFCLKETEGKDRIWKCPRMAAFGLVWFDLVWFDLVWFDWVILDSAKMKVKFEELIRECTECFAWGRRGNQQSTKPYNIFIINLLFYQFRHFRSIWFAIGWLWNKCAPQKSEASGLDSSQSTPRCPSEKCDQMVGLTFIFGFTSETSPTFVRLEFWERRWIMNHPIPHPSAQKSSGKTAGWIQITCPSEICLGLSTNMRSSQIVRLRHISHRHLSDRQLSLIVGSNQIKSHGNDKQPTDLSAPLIQFSDNKKLIGDTHLPWKTIIKRFNPFPVKCCLA